MNNRPINETCSKCRVNPKRPARYVSAKTSKLGAPFSYCNPCVATYMRERRAKMSPLERKQSDLRGRCTQYGITVAEFESMYAVVPGCAICNEPKDRYDLKIDHCHSTGRVRGLLCNHCNSAIGLLKDNHMNMKSAIDYIGAVL